MMPVPQKPVRFRPHHFFCTLAFEGKGYSPEFVRRYLELADRLKRPGGDEILIEVAPQADDICEPCPNRQGELCATQEKIERLDQAHAAVLGLRPGDVLSWKEAKQRLRTQMTPDIHEKACAPCGWKELGVCKAALLKLKSEHSSGGESNS